MYRTTKQTLKEQMKLFRFVKGNVLKCHIMKEITKHYHFL